MFAGTWKLDTAASRVDAAAMFNGLIAAGAPPMLYITQPANGALIVESPINEGHARIYVPGGKTATPIAKGGTITMTSAWTGATLVSEGTAVSVEGASFKITETFSVDAGNVLTVEIASTAADTNTSTLKYVRLADMGPCGSWPTPCKR
jgi:hypothetical protein